MQVVDEALAARKTRGKTAAAVFRQVLLLARHPAAALLSDRICPRAYSVVRTMGGQRVGARFSITPLRPKARTQMW